MVFFRKFSALALFALATAMLSPEDYNPPVLGEDLFALPYPSLISSGRSGAGGGIFTPNPASIHLNPALTAGMQRVSVDAAFVSVGAGEDSAGTALQATGVHLGFLFPTRYGVLTATGQGLFAPEEWPLGKSTLLLRGGFAKDITDKLYVGATLFAGTGAGSAIGADAGFLCFIGDLGPLTDSRFFAAAQNLGATFGSGDDERVGIDGKKKATPFPTPLTARVGFAALFLDRGDWQAGFSADAALCGFANVVIDAGVQLQFKRVTLSAAVNLNPAEESQGFHSIIPAVGLSYKTPVNTSGIDFLSGKGWQQTDIAVDALYQPVYEGGRIAGGGITANFGSKDTEAPEITLWPGEGGGK